MGLSSRLNKGKKRSGNLTSKAEDEDSPLVRMRNEVKTEMLKTIDFEALATTDQAEVRPKLRLTLERIIKLRKLPLSRMDREKLVEDICDNILGFGPLEVLMKDPDVSDIMINGPKHIFVERRGKVSLTNVKFDDNKHLMTVVERIVNAVGRRVDDQNPMVDARMKDGSRFNAIISPLSLDGAAVSIRRFGTIPITAEALIRFGSIPAPWMQVLEGCVRSKLNIIISGGTGSGKTTLLNVLSSFIPSHERLITIEDSAELQLAQEHVIRLETRPANLEGKGAINQRDLVRNSLRMRPDRVILGEIRGAEAVDMLTAMNTGHKGSLATVHANNPDDALNRFETMVGIGMPNMTDKVIRTTIARALDVVVQQSRLIDGSRRLMSVTELIGMEGSVILTQDIFQFQQDTIDKDGNVKGRFKATGLRPRFLSKLKMFGITISDDIFEWEMEV